MDLAFASLAESGYVYTPAPAPQVEAVKGPELCPECWNTTPVDAARAWAAVVALSRGQ